MVNAVRVGLELNQWDLLGPFRQTNEYMDPLIGDLEEMVSCRIICGSPSFGIEVFVSPKCKREYFERKRRIWGERRIRL
jgi:hypothetical protein